MATNGKTNGKTRPRSRPKLSTLLAIEIESAARALQQRINGGDKARMEESLRFIELQISFLREVNSDGRD